MVLTDLMTKASLALNLLVLAPVCTGLLRASPWTLAAFGPRTPARGILLSVYLAIAAASVLLLVRPSPAAIAALLLVQIVYKVTTPLTVGTLANPVVVSNLLIAAVHAVTLVLLVSAGRIWA